MDHCKRAILVLAQQHQARPAAGSETTSSRERHFSAQNWKGSQTCFSLSFCALLSKRSTSSFSPCSESSKTSFSFPLLKKWALPEEDCETTLGAPRSSPTPYLCKYAPSMLQSNVSAWRKEIKGNLWDNYPEQQARLGGGGVGIKGFKTHLLWYRI